MNAEHYLTLTIVVIVALALAAPFVLLLALGLLTKYAKWRFDRAYAKATPEARIAFLCGRMSEEIRKRRC